MSRGIIVLDGPDAAGKTTLANHLCKQLKNAEYLHLSAPVKGQAWNEHRAALLGFIRTLRAGKIAVVDRHFLSEAVYGAVYRDGSEYPYAARHVDRLLYRFGAIRVLCIPPTEHVVKEHRRMMGVRAEMYDDRMDEISNMYRNLWTGRPNPEKMPTTNYFDHLVLSGGVADRIGWVKYDVTVDGDDLNKYGEFLRAELIRTKELIPNFYEDSDNMTGWARKQSVLLVGDQCSNDEHWPFLSNAGSSLYLAKILNQLGADEAKVCMVNANGPGGEKLLRVAQIACGRVIALGREAERKLELGRITYHAKVRHPQHAARFTQKDNSYADELRMAFGGMAGVTCKA